MKRLIVFIIIVNTLVLLAACKDKQEDISEVTEENSISVNSIEKQEDVLNPKGNNSSTDIEDEKEDISVSEENSNPVEKEDNILNPTENEDEQENTSTKEENLTSQEITDLAKTMNRIVMKNIVTKLTEEQQEKFQELLHIENWEEQELPQRGISVDTIIRNDNGADMVFFEGNGVAIATAERDVYNCYIASYEEVEQLVEFALKVTDEGIKDNEDLIKQIHEFNGMIIGEPAELYDIKEENIYLLSEEELKELHGLLKVDQWKMYTGSEAVYGDENVPITLHKLLEGYDMLLQVKQYGELYIAKSRSYAGPTGEDYIFEISEEIYLNLIDFKDNILK